MAGTTIEGKEVRVLIDGVNIAGIGTFKYSPGAAVEIDDTEFGDTTEKILLGIRKRGTISFDGLAKLGNTEQEKLKRAQINGTKLTSFGARIAGSRQLVPNQTTGYHSPLSTTGNDTQPSWINITQFEITADKSGSAKVSFAGVVSGDLVEEDGT
ncbi:MAG: hypothetical protein A4E65_02314 [Syntrophorhabdus sp. PtaU1.Bin153]|nr:MAG: hypothetical protein A4E65_02314 [Syntrophorhabdus sp. PtaU1.Bin153]